MTHDDWGSGFKCVAVFLNGEAITAPNARGERVVDDSFLFVFQREQRAGRLRHPRRRLRRGMDRRPWTPGTPAATPICC